jgi:hypothetical protein
MQSNNICLLKIDIIINYNKFNLNNIIQKNSNYPMIFFYCKLIKLLRYKLIYFKIFLLNKKIKNN